MTDIGGKIPKSNIGISNEQNKTEFPNIGFHVKPSSEGKDMKMKWNNSL
jgi:hypothetical protein